jgi:predicted MFS family arabinose efflux permease
VFAARGAAGIAGSLLAAPCARWLGPGPAIIGGTLAVAVGALAAPLAGGAGPFAASLLVAGQLLVGTGTPVYSVNQLSVRQMVTPDHLLGRVNASRRFLVFGIAPVAALLGGAVAQAASAQAALFLGGAVMFAGFFWMLLSPVRGLGAQPRGPLAGAASG